VSQEWIPVAATLRRAEGSRADVASRSGREQADKLVRNVILLVEDNPDASAALASFLRAHHFEVVVAFDGQQGLERLRGGPKPSLILLDVMMPGKNAYFFRAEQLADAVLARIPVIVFSAAYDVGSIAQRLGVREYLPKPLDVQRLLDSVRRLTTPRLAARHQAVDPSGA
jgi:CheY-like chemotaxis protein